MSTNMLSTQWSNNLALASNKTEASDPAVNDGKLGTIAVVDPANHRVFGLKFAQTYRVRKVIIYNVNLFRFDLDYWDLVHQEWKQAHSVLQRRNLDGMRVQPKYVIDRLNFQTNMLRLTVRRTVDDQVISKTNPDPNDKVVNKIRKNFFGRLVTYFRVLQPSYASLREIEVYTLAKQE
ncbi:hypothetical protein CMK22_06335 [Candidatus Poribacteria bacterium]|nr:hypothetical protein [Candidatus Poribacteria bacterium]